MYQTHTIIIILIPYSTSRNLEIRSGKGGDLLLVSHLVMKFVNARILKMLLKGNTDPSKAHRAESIGELIGNWQDMEKSSGKLVLRQYNFSCKFLYWKQLFMP